MDKYAVYTPGPSHSVAVSSGPSVNNPTRESSSFTVSRDKQPTLAVGGVDKIRVNGPVHPRCH